MTTQRTLASLKEALQQPFAPETIQFLPKEIHQENGKYVCLALPYANKRIYEDRLNELVFGEWSSPYTPPYAQGNKLIIPATVVILGVAHMDYGEAYFTTTGKGGNTHEDDNTATEAYSQAFRRACSKFLVGRYLYDLPKYKLPYDPKTHQIAISKAERIAWVEKLYMERGLNPRSYSTPQRPVAQGVSQEQRVASVEAKAQSQNTQTTSASTISTQPAAPSASSAVQQGSSTPPVARVKTVPVQQETSTPPSAPQQKASSAIKKPQSAPPQPTNYPNATFLDWVAATVERDAERIQGICDYYHVTGLAQLTTKQRNELTKRLRKQASGKRQSASAATTSV
jgi:hypothetical protein